MCELKEIITRRLDVCEWKFIGAFKIHSGELVIGDPFFALNTGCLQETKQAEGGNWNFYVSYKGRLAAKILVIHETWEARNAEFRIADTGIFKVESGLMGVFDKEMYRNDNQFPSAYHPAGGRAKGTEAEKFYGACLENSVSEEVAGVLPFGCDSVAGHGIGEYTAETYHADGMVVAVSIVFMEDNDKDSGYFENEDF